MEHLTFLNLKNECIFQGFLPSNVASLRTLKADVVTGLAPGKAEETAKKDPNWMTGGDWGVVQLATKS